MPIRFWRMIDGLITAGTLSIAGCGGGPTLVPFSGTVLVNGKPMGDLRVEFLPDPGQGTQGPRSTATTDKDGSFQLVCEDENGLGAVVGMHRVLIVDLMRYEGISLGRRGAEQPLKPSRTSEKYSHAGNTPLMQEVKEGMGSVVFILAGAAGK